MRITTNQVLRNYQSNLSKSNNELNTSWNKVLTDRNFNKASEDPGAASQSNILRNQYLDNEDYIENAKTVAANYQSAESSVMEMNSIAQQAKALVTKGINGTASLEERKTIATSLRGLQESLVQSANAKLGDTFLFGGQNTSSAPFELKNGKLLYYGNDVGSNDSTVQTKLDTMSNQQILVDLGFGLSYDASGNVVNNSGFDTAFSGLKALGYGKNDDGVDKNIVNLLGNIADELENSTVDSDKIKSLSNQLDSSTSGLLNYVTGLGTKSKFLEQTESRLEDNETNLTEKISDLEQPNLAEAITNYSWAQFAYNAALKVGNSIISPSFIDFMK